MGANEKLFRLAADLADGQRVDWAEAESGGWTPDERATLEELRALASLMAATASAAPASQLRSPTTWQWGPLGVSEQLGSGRFGSVYRATDARLDRDVALKLLHRPSRDSAGSATIAEARLLARVRHPNVLTVHGAESIDGQIGIWSEFIDGRTLDWIVRAQGPFGIDEAATVGIDLSRALAAVHQAGLLHRDIKAQNVMRERGGRIVLMDFGTGQERLSESMASGELAGTPLYLAPELWLGGPATPQSDVYALGVLLYYLVTGNYPVRGASTEDIRSAHVAGRRSPLQQHRADVPQAFADAIDRALSADPAARYDSAQAFGAALRHARDSGDDLQIGRTTGATSLRRNVGLVWTLGVILLAAIGVLTFNSLERRVPVTSSGTLPAANIASGEVRALTLQGVYLLGRPSRDGTFPYVDRRGDLWVEHGDGDKRRITNSTAPEWAEYSVMSPGGQRIAVTWYGPDGRYSLRIMQADGTAAHDILTHETSWFPVPIEWSRDETRLLCWLWQPGFKVDLALVTLPGGAVNRLKHFDDADPMHASLSPDGRFVVFDRQHSENERDVEILRADGAPLPPFLNGSADDYAPIWTPDDRHLVFSSNRGGVTDGWAVEVVDGKLTGPPSRVAKSFGDVEPLGFTGDGTLLYNLETGRHESFSVPIDLTGAARVAMPSRITSTFDASHYGPSWSPDGQSIAYILFGRPDTAVKDNALEIKDARGMSHAIPVPGLTKLGIARPRWSPDGRRVIVRGRLDSQEGYFQVDVKSGDAMPVLLFKRQDSEHGPFLWSPDGRAMVYSSKPRGIVRHDLATHEEAILVAMGSRTNIEQIAFSPGGDRIAFSSSTTSAAGSTAAIEVAAIGGESRELLRVSAPQGAVVQAWTPDGTGILYLQTGLSGQASPSPLRLWTVSVADRERRDLGIAIRTREVASGTLNPRGRLFAYTEDTAGSEPWTMTSFLPWLRK